MADAEALGSSTIIWGRHDRDKLPGFPRTDIISLISQNLAVRAATPSSVHHCAVYEGLWCTPGQPMSTRGPFLEEKLPRPAVNLEAYSVLHLFFFWNVFLACLFAPLITGDSITEVKKSPGNENLKTEGG